MKGVAILGERVRQRVAENCIDLGGVPCKVTVSLGTSTFDPIKTLCNKSVFINAADKALYDAKIKGKDRISVASLPLVT
jgi:PleD family two-component response regulator